MNIQVHVSCMLFCWVDLGVELLGHILCLCPVLVDNAKLPVWIYLSVSIPATAGVPNPQAADRYPSVAC